MTDINTTSLVFFGDSLSDPGNLYGQTEGILPEFARETIGDADGQISNGDVWTQQIGAVLGSTTGLNYAVAGAEATGSQRLGDFLAESLPPRFFLVEPDDPALHWDMNLSAQIDRFLADTAGQDGTTYTAVILIGGNDFATVDFTQSVDEVLATIQPVADAVRTSTLAAVVTLLTTADSDVAQAVVVSMPLFSFFPAFAVIDPADVAQYDAVIAEMNAGIAADIADLNDSLGGGTDLAAFVDFEMLSDALFDDAGSFGLLAPASLTLSDDAAVLAGFDDDQVMFWDELHPTEATHGIIAGFTAAAIEGSLLVLTDGDDAGDLALPGGQGTVVFAYGGDDTLRMSDADDIVFGGSGSDALIGFAGEDQLSGGAGADVLRGGQGQDVLDGGAGDDLLFGNFGNDVILDGTGSDLAYGGLGNDIFIWIEEILMAGVGGAFDMLFGGQGHDTLYVVLSTETFAAYGDALAGDGQTEALAALGIAADRIEEVVVLQGRQALDVLSGEDWFASADLWGLV